jgi:hypothetical protein
MTAGTRVLITQPCKMSERKACGAPDQGRPKLAMNKRDLPGNEATYEDLLRRSNRSCYLKDFLAARMRPPTTANRSANDGLD